MLYFFSCAIVILFHLVVRLASCAINKVLPACLFPSCLRCTKASTSSSASGAADGAKLPRGARVAVIGGGIAGTAAAWSLAASKACDEVWLFEPRSVLGGNAKTYAWSVDGGSRSVVTGLSVLAWPTKYFRHYEMLLRKLGIRTQTVTPKFFISADGATPVFRQGQANAQWAKDQDAWDRAVAFVRRVNNICVAVSDLLNAIVSNAGSFLTCGWWFRHSSAAPTQRCFAPSMYTIVYWNPMNVVPARFLCQRLFGVSDAFWEQVVVGIYSSSFLTARLDDVPSVILPPLDDIISVGRADPLKSLHTWEHNSKHVFDQLAAEITQKNTNKNKIMLDTTILSCVYAKDRNQWTLTVCKKGSRDVFELVFDWVVFACPATAVDSLTNFDTNRNSGFRSALFESLVPSVLYENQRDENFVTGSIHAQRNALPEAFRAELIQERYSNYIEIFGNNPTDACVENTFILGTWVPAAVRDAALHIRPPPPPPPAPPPPPPPPPAAAAAAAAAAASSARPAATLRRRAGKDSAAAAAGATTSSEEPISTAAAAAAAATNRVHDMYVTYNCSSEQRQRSIGMPLGEVDNSWAHPQLSMASMAVSMAMPLLQGRANASYCASYTTPGNGHDLSLLSGLVVARSLTGYYPFEAEAGVAERSDFAALASIMDW